MTIQELRKALEQKGFQLQERRNLDEGGPALWAFKPLSAQEHHLGVKEALLSQPLEDFLRSTIYQEIGRNRESIINAFVDEWIESVARDYVDEENRPHLYRRIQRLYDELREADW